jgi:hypothetical protein
MEKLMNDQVAYSDAVTEQPAKLTSQERLYIHELLDIRVKGRRDWLDTFSLWAENAGKAPEPRKSRIWGIWGTVGFSHRWAEAVMIWENDSKQALAARGKKSWEHFYADDMSGDTYDNHWGVRAYGDVTDSQGMDRLICATDYSPTQEQLIADGATGDLFIHNHIATPPGEIDDHLLRLGRDWVPIARRLGLKLIGAYRTLFVNDDQGISIWVAPSWEAWADFEDKRRTDKEALEWRKEVCARGVTWDGRMMAPARSNPFLTGKPL